jgi:ParB-like chromosome segregation protein Spo0J
LRDGKRRSSPAELPRRESLADSLNRLGLLNPITVYPEHYSARGRSDNPGFRVIAGRNRYEAAKLLGWEEIDAFVVEGSDFTTRRLVEITENLHRAELSALERAKMIEEWVELTGGESAQLAPIESKRADGRGHRAAGGLNDAARQLGIERTEVQRSVKIASLFPEAQDAAREHGLDDNKAALLEAARKETPEEQAAALKLRFGRWTGSTHQRTLHPRKPSGRRLPFRRRGRLVGPPQHPTVGPVRWFLCRFLRGERFPLFG